MSEKDEDELKKWCQEDFFPNCLFPVLTRLNNRLADREWFITDEVGLF